MAHYMYEAPSDVHNRFTTFYTAVRNLGHFDFIRTLGNRDPDHYLCRALVELQKAAEAAANQTAWQGPLSANIHSPQNSYDEGWNGRPAHRPSTPSYSAGAGLHPGTFTPEPSPSRYPGSDSDSNRSSAHASDLLHKIARLEEKLEQSNNNFVTEQRNHQKAELALRESREESGYLNEALLERDDQLVNTSRELEETHVQAINLCEQAQMYEDAIRHLDRLYVLKVEEAKSFDRRDNRDAAKTAEYKSLDYEQQKGRMLKLNCRYADAEVVLRRNLKSRKDVFGSEHVTRYRESRNAQLQFCQVLRKQKLDDKTTEAEALYERHAFVTRLEGKNDSSREWAFRNAAGLVATRIELRDYKHAMQQMQDLWENRSKVPTAYVRELDSEILDMVAVLERREEPEPLIDALKILCCGDPGEVNSRIVPCYIQLGRLLHETGGKKANEEAIVYLQDAWVHRERVDVDDQRSTLWGLAISHATLDHWAETKKHLDDLKKYDNSQGIPSADMITALKARVQLNAGEFLTAETTAASLWDRYGTKNVLRPAVSLHQVDTLIKAASKQKEKDRFTEAKKIWDDVYQDASKGRLSKEEMKQFAATGKMFADDWENSRKRHSKNLTSPGKIRNDARDMLKWAES